MHAAPIGSVGDWVAAMTAPGNLVGMAKLDQVVDSDVTVLFGAGVTRDAGGPTAEQLVTAIAQGLVDDDAARRWVSENIQPNGPLRFEMAMDELRDTADPDLEALNALRALRPGRLHALLANAA